jgi:hypothetical protein
MPDGNHPARNRFANRRNFNFDAHQRRTVCAKQARGRTERLNLALWFGGRALLILDVERFGDQARLLAFVSSERTDCGTGAGTTACIGDVATEKLP